MTSLLIRNPIDGIGQQKLKKDQDKADLEQVIKAKDYAKVAIRNEEELHLLAEYAVDYAHSIGKYI